MIKSIYVKQFRAMKELHIPLGRKITVIAGQNATCKSTLLGMIGQPFGLKNERTIFGKLFSTKFSDIFKFSEKYDLPGKHEYQIEFYDSSLFGKNLEYIKSYKRAPKDKSHIRLVVGKTRGKGEGNLDYPDLSAPIQSGNWVKLPSQNLLSPSQKSVCLTSGTKRYFFRRKKYLRYRLLLNNKKIH